MKKNVTLFTHTLVGSPSKMFYEKRLMCLKLLPSLYSVVINYFPFMTKIVIQHDILDDGFIVVVVFTAINSL